MNTCPNCGMVKGMHGSILPGCMCPWTPQETNLYGDGNVYRGVRTRDSETQFISAAVGDVRAFKYRIHELEGELMGYKKIVADQDAMLERQTARIVDLQTHIENLTGEE